MSKKGVSLLSINLSKVCLENISSDSIKTLAFFRNINTATERSELPTSKGYYLDHSDQNYQNPGDFYGETQYSAGLGHSRNPHNLNPNVGFIENHRNEPGRNSVGGSGDFIGFYGQRTGNLPHNFNGNIRSVSGAKWESMSKFHGYPVEKNGNFSEYNGHTSGQFQQSYAEPQGQLTGTSPAISNSTTQKELDRFLKEGKVTEAVEYLRLVEKQHVPVDLLHVLQLIQACGEAKALPEAKAVHEHVMRSLSPLKVNINNKIIEMYSKCGSMTDAFDVFKKMQERNMTSWDLMITWLAKNGHGEDAIDLFNQFKQAGLKPDGEMFVAVFSACSVVGDATEGMLHFESMRKDYGIIPTMQHYLSIVDMLGSNGYLDEALEFIEKMPMEPNVDVWESLMKLSRVHGHMELGDRCAEIVKQLDESRLNEQSRAGLVPVTGMDLTKEKEKGLTSQNISEVRSKVHEYRAGDTSHPDSHRHYVLLRGLKEQMKEAGYIPETRFVLHDIDQEGKEEALLSHSERLATAHALLTSPARSTIRIIKNLRVCVDCHNALKIISKIVGRQLVMRDSKRFHHLKDGVCSCGDYW